MRVDLTGKATDHSRSWRFSRILKHSAWASSNLGRPLVGLWAVGCQLDCSWWPRAVDSTRGLMQFGLRWWAHTVVFGWRNLLEQQNRHYVLINVTCIDRLTPESLSGLTCWRDTLVNTVILANHYTSLDRRIAKLTNNMPLVALVTYYARWSFDELGQPMEALT
ncbi:hypothetical protein GW17_00023862 [Ensete ventricosum]|nr:hypothetical protein GW17_00023862 [Ensete ventricosum]